MMMYNTRIALEFLIDPTVLVAMNPDEFGRQVALLTKAHPWKADHVNNAVFELVEIKQLENQSSGKLTALIIVLEAKSAVANSAIPSFESWASSLWEAARVFCPVDFVYSGISHAFDHPTFLSHPNGGGVWSTFTAGVI